MQLRHPRVALPALLGLGVLGVLGGFGVATTSAAWTDDAYFTAQGSTGTVDLRGSSDGVDFTEADSTGTAVTLAAVSGLTPDTPVTRTIHLWNASTVPLALSWATAPTALLDGCVEVDYQSLAGVTLASGPDQPVGAAVTTATVTFRVADDAPAATCSGKSLDAVQIVVQGSPA
ncbi:hypothetical protein [Cellulomonas palmilytica]|uniref:hypothetical protein n=1 Tax=Cellulomonas palmilytica TaxID=2608402 RepID=UPI001F24A381|nr:hypothetical protein [Cellulomonas palmilytica]UJP40959.1 hypothetical protein F1D97_05700 [Cellulomonas palmilytica]